MIGLGCMAPTPRKHGESGEKKKKNNNNKASVSTLIDFGPNITVLCPLDFF